MFHIITTFIIALVLLTAYTNCQPFEISNEMSSFSSQCDIFSNLKKSSSQKLIPKAGFSALGSKMLLGKNELGVLSKASPQIQTDEQLLIVMDLGCYREDPSSLVGFSEQFIHQDLMDLPSSMNRGAIGAYLKSPLSVTEIESLVADFECVLSVDRTIFEEKMFAVETVPDNWVQQDFHANKQDYLTYMRADLGYKYFFDAEKGIDQPVTVGVVDTGIYYGHEDVDGDRLWRQPQGQNLVGFNAINTNQDALDESSISHGTKVSGIISAHTGNSDGIAGVARNVAEIMALKFIQERTTTSSVVKFNAVQYGMDNGAEVFNFSFGSPVNDESFKTLLEEAVINNNIFIAVAAGNEGQQLDPVSHPVYPALWSRNIDGLISVGGLAPGFNQIWRDATSGSNYSRDFVEIASQGERVYTLLPFDPFDGFYGSFYDFAKGTSFSAPMVAAAATLAIGMLKTHDISYNVAEIEDLIKAGALSRTSQRDNWQLGRTLDLAGLASVMSYYYPQTVSANSPIEPSPTNPLGELNCP